MRKVVLAIGLVTMMLLAPNTIAASEPGVDVNPESNEPFTIIERDTPSVDNERWSLTIEMSQDAYDNGTNFEIVTQICTNDGVCDPPEIMNADIEERIHSISLTPPSDHTYVNWRVKALDSNGNKTNYPHGDWFKTWSTCYYSEGSWGGSDSNGDGCAEKREDVPGFTLVYSIMALSAAFALITRRQYQEK